MASLDEVDARLVRLEARLERLTELLERSLGAREPKKASANGAAAPLALTASVLTDATNRADAALRAAYPPGEVEDKLADLLIRLAEPETLETLARVAVLMPQLEYALQGLAAGPELLEEGLAALDDGLRARGTDAVEVKRRLAIAAEVAQTLSRPEVLRAVGQLAGASVDLDPLVRGAAEAARDRAAVEGSHAVASRLKDALLELTDEGTLAALTRIATLAPDLEYAVQAVAAGPTLLEEGLELARARLAAVGLTLADADRRLDGAVRALTALSDTASTAALAELAGLLPHLSPIALALGDAGRDLASAEGAGVLRSRLGEAVVRLADPEVLDALVRIATLAPDLEYAANAVAAGPVLLEEGLELVTAWTRGNVGDKAALDARLRAGAEALTALSEPKTLASLAQLAQSLPALARSLPKLEPKLEQLATLTEKLDTGALLELAALTAKPQHVAALKGLIELAPSLERTLSALPVQAATLRVLETVNAAVEQATSTSESLSMWGLLGALRDPEVQKAAGFGIEVARQLGRHLEDPEKPARRALPARRD